MIKLTILSIVITLLGFSQAGYAGTVEGKVSWIQVNVKTGFPDFAFIKFDTLPTNSPSCATDVNGRMGVSLQSEAGKAVYSMALAAQVSGKTIWASGTNGCIAGTVEEIDYIRLKNYT